MESKSSSISKSKKYNDDHNSKSSSISKSNKYNDDHNSIYKISARNIEILFYLSNSDKKDIEQFKLINPKEVVKHIDINEIEVLEKYLKTITDNKFININVFLITSGSKGKELNNKSILNQKEISDVFIYCYDEEINKQWSKDIVKIKLVSSDFNKIGNEIRNRLTVLRHNSNNLMDDQQKAAYFYDTREACLKYIFHQCLINLFTKDIFNNKNSKQDFINFCNSNFENFKGKEMDYNQINQAMQDNKFNNSNIIWWYTKDSFFYRLINQVLRNENKNEIFQIRYALYELSKALTEINDNTNPKKLYRGSLLSREELKIMMDYQKTDSPFIQLRGFFSTSSDINVSYGFSFEVNENLTSVIYEIDVKDEFVSKIYNISNYSEYKQENEYLLSYNTSVRIIKIEKLKNEDKFEYKINVSLCEYKEIKNFIDAKTMNGTDLIDEINNKNYEFDYFYFCDILRYMREDDCLIHVLDHCKKNDFIDNHNEASFYNWYGLVYNDKRDLDRSLEYYLKCLEIREQKLGKEHPDTALTYNNIGVVYNDKGDLHRSLEYYLKCLKIQEQKLGKEHPDTATTYNNIGLVYSNKGDLDRSLEYYLKCLKIQEQKLGKEHPLTATTYNNIGSVYSNKGDLDRSLEYYLKCLKIREQKLGKEHPDTALTYNNIGGVYYNKGDLDRSLEYYLKCLEIQEQKLGKEHPHTAITYNNIGNVYSNKGDLDRSLEYYLKCLEIQEQKLGKEHPDTATTYNNIGLVYSDKGDLDRSLEYYLKCLEIQEQKLGKEHPSTKRTQAALKNILEKK